MTMKKTNLVWRLSNRPTADEIVELRAQEIITKEEARELLFNQETEEERDKKSLQSEIKFLRELVDKLSNSKLSTIVETIRYVEKPYYKHDWYKPYITWSTGTDDSITYCAAGSGGTLNADASISNSAFTVEGTNTSFTDIKTF